MQWVEESRDALASSNDYVERSGLPLERFAAPPRNVM